MDLTDKSITQIAEELGFQSIHTFSRAFTKAEGVSPSFYQNNKTERRYEF